MTTVMLRCCDHSLSKFSELWEYRMMRIILITFIFIFMIAVHRFSSKVEAHVHPDLFPPSFVTKNHESANRRVIFVVGLEGTGHHILQSMFTTCINLSKKRNITATNLKACEVEAALSKYMFRDKHQGAFFADDEKNLGKNIEGMQKRFQQIGNLPAERHIFVLGLGVSPGSGEMSYPNFNYKSKVLDHPNSFALASFAEAAGVDLRIIVLQRSAAAIISSTGRRNFGTSQEPEVPILIDNAAVIFAELSLLDDRFYYCIDFDTLVAENWQSMPASKKVHLQEFLNPSVIQQSVLQLMVGAINSTTDKSHHQKPSHDKHKKMIASEKFEWAGLDVRLRLIEQRCQSKRQREDIARGAIQGSKSHKTMLTKSVFGPNRLLMITGVVGSGLNAIKAMLDVCVNIKSDHRCKPELLISELLFNDTRRSQDKGQFTGLFVARDVQMRASYLEKIHRDRLAEFASNHKNFVHILGLGYGSSGMMSYPNFNGEESMNHPDAFALAQLAEISKVDMRVIVVLRNASDIIASLRRRRFGNTLLRRMLVDNAAVLFTQLYMLDRRFYTCVEYDSLSSMSEEEQRHLADFIHPEIITRTVMAEMTSRVRQSSQNLVSTSDTAVNMSWSKMSPTDNMDMPPQEREVGLRRRYLKTTAQKTSAPAQSKSSTKPLNKSFHAIPKLNKTGRDDLLTGLQLDEQLRLDRIADRYHENQLQARLELIRELCARSS